MINALVIAPTFLRSSCAVGQIVRHLFSNLNNNHHSHILCSSNYDLKMCEDQFTVYPVPESKLPHYIDIISHRIRFTDFSYSPDSFYYSWNKNAYKEAVRIIGNSKVDYILTINNPVSSHLLGLKLKKEYNIPWVVYLFDPWHNNPFRKYKFTYLNHKDECRERYVAENADMLLFPNHELMESWAMIYGDCIKHKSYVLPFATNIPKISESRIENERLTISHIGNLSESRRAKVFLEALCLIREKNPDLLRKVQFNIVGYLSNLDKNIIAREKLYDVVNLVGHVSEEECTKYYESSDLFLIVDIDCSPNLFYPSKLLKYFCYQKPIIGITTDNSVVANELNKTGNHVFGYDDSLSVSDFLYRTILNREIANTNDTQYYKQFLSENVAVKYRELIEKIL